MKEEVLRKVNFSVDGNKIKIVSVPFRIIKFKIDLPAEFVSEEKILKIVKEEFQKSINVKILKQRISRRIWNEEF